MKILKSAGGNLVEYFKLSIKEAHALLQNKDITVKELTESVFQRIEAVERTVNAFVTVTTDKAFEMVEKLPPSQSSNLFGIPMAIKDNMCTRGIKTTCSSKILANFIPPYESTVTDKLLKSGYILTGKANMDEFAMGSSTENSGFFTTKNPWDTERAPGGSSGGSAAAVCADECIAALGSDTGGSIRQPASFCGVVGLKPTYGRVSRFGLVAFASSLDQIGPITKTVEDSAILLNAISGHDPLDSTSATVSVPDFTASIGRDIKGLRVGIPSEYFIDGMEREVEQSVKAAISHLETLGAQIVDISLPHTGYAVAAYYILATSEASSNLARFDGIKYGLRVNADDLIDTYMKSRAAGFGTEVKRRIMLGTYALSSGYYDAYYKKAQQVRTLIKQDFDRAFEKVDIIATPTAPTTAFKIGEKVNDPLQMYLSDIFTISVNLAGVPAISLPCGFDQKGLPIGLQLIGEAFDEETILKAAYAYEASTPHHTRRPTL
ncbi:MAG: Asp-tRNA(Asn)/Glu-tRNA(Gln) amidotransferase subunit GatA [Nitrospirae bacterium]|nr:Asp-tRNA(Asn)/Glu-tRNA(Gln) amidotransferase subunit GatA [Nitrospirota bacterium]MBF0533741.1 Asp-tRNA(Asn)/Glu-tRNA(Gln) amidotransferase subunit GatA [Nitrospirota bacterium]MBF0615550.1 Asp-tRNA(Asn)/Glu-tRNA(Gln) amidotransferase subunit GatA [Nitrospirota bacterium]